MAAVGKYKTAWSAYEGHIFFAANLSGLTANGEAGKTTTELTLTVDKTISLTAEDITLTGAVKGTLTAKGNGVYTLGISDITVADGANVRVTLGKDGVEFTPVSRDVKVYKAATVEQRSFKSLTANGATGKTTTTELTLTLDKAVAGLTAGNITVTGASRGALTPKGSGVYTLGISGITADNTNVTVKLTKSGVAFTPDSKTVKVFKAVKPTDKILVPLPELKQVKYTYTGAPIKAEFTAYDTAIIASSETTGTEVGTYETILSLKDTTKYMWDTDNNQDGKWQYTWEIVAVDPTPSPTVKPSATPTQKPVIKPTAAPTAKPVVKPTAAPTAKPGLKPEICAISRCCLQRRASRWRQLRF